MCFPYTLIRIVLCVVYGAVQISCLLKAMLIRSYRYIKTHSKHGQSKTTFNLPLLSFQYSMSTRFSVCDVFWQWLETHFIIIALNAFFSLLFLNTRLYNSFITKGFPCIEILVIIGNKGKIVIPINQGVFEWRSLSPVIFNNMV